MVVSRIIVVFPFNGCCWRPNRPLIIRHLSFDIMLQIMALSLSVFVSLFLFCSWTLTPAKKKTLGKDTSSIIHSWLEQSFHLLIVSRVRDAQTAGWNYFISQEMILKRGHLMGRFKNWLVMLSHTHTHTHTHINVCVSRFSGVLFIQ